MSDLDDELILAAERYADDSLSPQERQALCASLDRDAARRDRFLVLLREQVALRAVLDSGAAARSASAILHQLQAGRTSRRLRVADQVRHRLRPRRRRRAEPLRWGAWVAAAAGIAIVVALALAHGPGAGPAPSLGFARLDQGDLRSDAGIFSAGATLPDATTLSGTASLLLHDGSRLSGDGSLSLDSDHRRIRLSAGRWTMQAAHQEPGRPLALTLRYSEATIIGTRFDLSLGDQDERIAVSEGLVAVRHLHSGTLRQVGAGQALRANAEGLWPDPPTASTILSAPVVPTRGVQLDAALLDLVPHEDAAADRRGAVRIEDDLGPVLALPRAGLSVTIPLATATSAGQILRLSWRDDAEEPLALRVFADDHDLGLFHTPQRSKAWLWLEVALPAGCRSLRLRAETGAIPAKIERPGQPWAAVLRLDRLVISGGS